MATSFLQRVALLGQKSCFANHHPCCKCRNIWRRGKHDEFNYVQHVAANYAAGSRSNITLFNLQEFKERCCPYKFEFKSNR